MKCSISVTLRVKGLSKVSEVHTRDVPDIRSLYSFIRYPMFFSLTGIRPDSASIRLDIRYSICLFHLKILLLYFFSI